MIDYAIELGHSCVAITDHECLSSFIQVEEYYEQVKKSHPDFKVIRGNEIYLTRNSLNGTNFDKNRGDAYFHFILLAKDLEGYHQLCELSTRAWKRSYIAQRMRRVPTYYKDLKEIVAPNPGHLVASSACFQKGTQVETKDGWKNIEDLTNLDYVINRYGEWEKVIEPTRMPFYGEGYKLELTGNDVPITCTYNHEFLAYTNNRPYLQWIPANKLKIETGRTKHILVTPVITNYHGKDKINKKDFIEKLFPKSIYSAKRYVLPEIIEITPELMRLFGLFLGDGCISLKTNPRIEFTLNIKEFEPLWESTFAPVEEQLNIQWNKQFRENNHRVDIGCFSRELIELFYYIFGDVKSNSKFIPDKLRINKELDYELLFGYLLADGYFRAHTSPNKKIQTGESVSASISKQLSWDIYKLCDELKLCPSISYVPPKINKYGNHKECWYISCSSKYFGYVNKKNIYSHEDVKDLFESIAEDKITRDYINFDNICYRKIRIKKRIPIILNEEVYCLNNTTHSFKCNNVIVHNCLGGQLPRFLLNFRDTGDEKYYETALNWCRYMVGIFGEGNFYLEMQPSHHSEQIFVNRHLMKISKELGIPYIITLDAHYLKQSDAIIHEKYLNSQDGDREVKSFYETTYMMDTKELESFFDYLTEEQLQQAYQNIIDIANKCTDFSIKRPLRIPHLPWLEHNHKVDETDLNFYCSRMPSLKKFLGSPRVADRELFYATIDGIEKHPDLQNEEAYKALEECLDMTWVSSEVNNAEWSAYFLNIQKIIEECWNAGTIVLPARGSGGGFVLLYCLDIIQMNCLREKTKMRPYRFLNPARVSVLDIDFDVSGLKRKQVLDHFREVYGEERVCNVLTLRTEKSKSAILTACRGLNMTPEEGQYFASLISAERGMLYSLKETYYGDEEKGLKPNQTFVQAMNANPELWEVAQRIEGLICGLGIHAGGVVFNDEPFTNTCSLMRAPDGTIISGFELHDLEKVSLIKYDALSVEGADRIQVCLELLIKYGYVKPESTLRQTYEKVVGVYNLERDDPKMWSMIHNHEIVSLFQMEKSSGIQGIALTKPESVDDLAALNSALRLMKQSPDSESPLDKYARFKNHPEQWEREMDRYGLTEEEKKILHKELDTSYGMCIAQEQFMELVQIPEIGGFDLQWADKLRKAVAKKSPKDYDRLTKEYFANVKKKQLSQNLCNYVFNVLISVNKGYGFNQAHTAAYSLIALQEMNLAYKYPIIFWNTANLIVDSAGTQEVDEEDPETLVVELEESESEEEIVDIYEPEDWEEYDYEDLPDRSAKKKKKNKSIDFGKIAMAIGKFQLAGITILPPDINKSDFSFTPDVENNSISSGLRNITRISADLVNEIITHRPYSSIADFREKVKVNKLQMLNLLKCGAFDNLYPDRMAAIKEFVSSLADVKTNLTLANVPMLVKYNVLGEEAANFVELFMYNKFLRKHMNEDKTLICIPPKALEYYCNHFDMDLLADANVISVKLWEKQYKEAIKPFSEFLKDNKDILLSQLNKALIGEQLEGYEEGNLSHYEMESMSFYYHDHELKNVDEVIYDLVNFNDLPEEPVVEKTFTTKDGNEIKIYKLSHICGTVLDRNKMKGNVSLLTPHGVVNVKVWKNQFAKYDKQISEVGTDGKKHVREKSWFQRGSLLYLQGIRRGDCFIPKAYKSSVHRIPIMKITSVSENGKDISFTNLRYDEL